MGAVAEQPPNRGERWQAEPQPEGPAQRPTLPAVGRRDHCPLQHVPDPAKVVLTITSQAEGRLGELLLQHAGPELDQQVRLDLSPVPQTVCRSRRHRQLLARCKLEPSAVDGKRRGSRKHGKARFLDGMDVGVADAAAGREPRLVLDELAVGFGGSL